MSADDRRLWDGAAPSFDDEPDHGLRDPAVRAAWAALLLPLVPCPRARIADLGCGTGSLSHLFGEAGHDVVGLDFSPAMLRLAVAKPATGARRPGAFRPVVADVGGRLPLRDGSVDLVVARHVVWALRSPADALGRWVRLLRPDGVLVLVEGRWSTGAGLPADELAGLVRRRHREAEVTPLPDAELWGRPVTDERYLLVSRR